jgi:hypothetical protein
MIWARPHSRGEDPACWAGRLPRELLDQHLHAAGIHPLGVDDGELVLEPEQH